MLPDSEIKRYGGKGAIINHVAANIPEMHIPRYIIKRQEDSFDGIIPEFNSMKKPVIVRSSSPHEYGDYEGIFDSLKGITDEYSLIRAIEQIEASAKSEHAKRYAEINSFPLDDTIHAIIQEQSDSRYCGAMMRHPNNPDLIFMSLYLSEFDIGFDNRQRYFNYLFDEQKNTKRKNIYFTTNSDFSENTARFLAEKYRQIEALTDSANGYSLFVEFGLKPFQFYQARPFKKIETADFELPKILESKDSLSTKLVFGITPEDGIVLPVIRSIGYMEAKLLNPLKFVGMDETEKISLDGMADMSLLMSLENAHDCSKESLEPQKYLNQAIENWNLSMDDSLKGKPYCFMTSSVKNDLFAVDLSVPNMNTLIIGETQNFLVHGMMRLLKASEVSFMRGHLFVNKFYRKATSLEDQVRIISNGKESIAIKE